MHCGFQFSVPDNRIAASGGLEPSPGVCGIIFYRSSDAEPRGTGLKVLLMQNFQTAATVLTHPGRPHLRILPNAGQGYESGTAENAA